MLVKCPKDKCLRYIKEEDILLVFTKKEREEIEDYYHKSTSSVKKEFFKCVLCGSPELSKVGCSKHVLCAKCYLAN